MPDKTPMQARTMAALLQRPDQAEKRIGDWLMSVYPGHVRLCQGEALNGVEVVMPRDVFEQMLAYYVTGDPDGKLEVDDDKNG